MKIYAYARNYMKKHGNPNQWGPTNWPPEELIHRDIAIGKSYVCVDENEQILATFYYDYGKDIEPTYARIEDGQWTNDSAYGVVHRIASAGIQKGAGRFCIEWAYNQCGHLRIDTHADNRTMRNLLNQMGFRVSGTIYVHEDNDPRIAFEKYSEK